jgi:hypothetical protein
MWRGLAGEPNQRLFRNAERRQDVAQHHEGADQRRRAILVSYSLKDRRDVAHRDGEPSRQVVVKSVDSA